MPQLSNILDAPILYLTYQYVVGGIQARSRCVRDHVQTQPGYRVLDIGCGPGYVADWLKGVAYIGLDTDIAYIRYAQRRYSGKGSFFCELMTDEFLLRHEPFDFVLMNGVLHHLDDVTVSEVLRLSHKALKPGGKLVTLDGYYSENLHAVARFLLNRDRGKFIRRIDEYLALARPVFPDVQPFDHPDYFRVPYTTLVMECRRTA
jgi:SAM-dependent methyltransferase